MKIDANILKFKENCLWCLQQQNWIWIATFQPQGQKLQEQMQCYDTCIGEAVGHQIDSSILTTIRQNNTFGADDYEETNDESEYE
jgi:hypothetical protein